MSENNQSSLLSFVWDKIPQPNNSKIPPTREGSICAFDSERNSIIIFSGQGATRYSDLHTFDMASKLWTEQKTKGLAPQSLSHAASWYDTPYLFFQGGRSNQDKSLSDTFFLDLETYTWRKLFTMEQPSSRYGHTAVRNDDKQAYVFGGCNIGKKDHRFLNDLHKCEYKSIKIVEGEENNVNGASWITNVACKGVKPAGRKGHSMILLNNIIYLFGGELKQGFTDENMYKFSIDDKEWSIVNIQGEKLPFNGFSCLSLINESHIMVFGGKGKEQVSDEMYLINLKNFNCCKIQQSGTPPGKRMGYMTCFNQENNNILIGGSDDNGLSSMDVYILKETKANNSNKIPNSNTIKEEKEIRVKQKEKTSSGQDYPTPSQAQQNSTQNPQIISQPQSQVQLQPQNQPQQTKIATPQKKVIQTPEQNIRNQKVEPPRKRLSPEEVNKLEEMKAQFINKYESNMRLTQNYQDNLYTIEELCKRDIECTLIKKYKLNQSKGSNGLAKISKKNEEIKELKEYNLKLNDYLNNSKEKFCLISDMLSDYTEDIRQMDDILLRANNKDMVYLINYDVLNEKRRVYKEKLIHFFKEMQVYTKYEHDSYNFITQKKNEKKNLGCFVGDQKTISFREGNEGDLLDYNNS